MNFAGLDPDKNGAIALISSEYKILELIDMPVLDTGKKGANKIAYDAARIAYIIDSFETYGPLYAVLEEPIVWTPKKPKAGDIEANTEGKSHMGNTHMVWKGFGICKGVLAATNTTYTIVHPRKWKTTMNVPQGQGKEASIAVAKELFPSTTPDRTFIKDRGRKETLHGRADALLLAAYGLRTHQPNQAVA